MLLTTSSEVFKAIPSFIIEASTFDETSRLELLAALSFSCVFRRNFLGTNPYFIQFKYG